MVASDGGVATLGVTDFLAFWPVCIKRIRTALRFLWFLVVVVVADEAVDDCGAHISSDGVETKVQDLYFSIFSIFLLSN